MNDERSSFARVALGFAAFFLLLCSYYILRPVRDEMAVQTGVSRIQWLFTGTFVATVLTVPLFGWVVKRVPRARLLPGVYAFFIITILIFQVVFLGGTTLAMAAAFFIWLSVFNLFVVSLFWSNVSDVFTTAESHRVYGYIAAGGSAGALTGPAITALLARHVSTSSLLAISAVLLAAATACAAAMRRGAARRPDQPAPEEEPIGGSIFAGVWLTWRVISLRGVAFIIIFYTAVSTVLYVEQADVVGRTFADTGERTAFFATIDLAVNGLALITQIVITRRLVERRGLRTTLAVVPLLVAAGLSLLGMWRGAFVLAIVQIVHRAGEFSLTRPGREMIFTTVDAESRYKAKNFIDTTVYRGNDALASWVVALIRGAGLSAVALLGIPVAVLWLFTGYRIGRRHDEHQPA
ncbi:MAG TPA: MFS transporter [Thermoanaerobaculia bacterium]|nr:MFS transporter [Thermoanaerobaculia bacterium]